ncbi:MAG: DPP IV N-terminal domain-containing protein [Chloroflexota bacterium]
MNRSHALITSILFILLTLLSACVKPFEAPTATPGPTQSPSATPSPSPIPSSTPTKTSLPQPADLTQTFILSMDDNGYSHLFAYAPEKMTPVRMTNGLWNDITPAINHAGNKVIFASNRNAYWDLYTLDLTNGQITRVTDTPDFDGNPAWSPDDQWVTYETMIGDQLEINILSTNNPGQIIQLTDNPAMDQDPAWSPLGREVAFVSNRSGENEIWVASLDKTDDGRFVNISQSPQSDDTHPSWSPDGSKLAWAAHTNGEPEQIQTWDSTQSGHVLHKIGAGNWPAWSASGQEISTRLTAPNQDYLVAYTLDGKLTLPPYPVPDLHGLDWKLEKYTNFANTFYQQSQLTPTKLWEKQAQQVEDIPGQRNSISKLMDVDAPHPYLHNSVFDSFLALRQRIIADTGWDALASLENAYTPLTSALDPGKGQDWLYTGRAFAINPLTLNAGLMLVMREEIDGRTFWRTFLRTVAQDGSQGEPLRSLPWDLTSRYSLDPAAYDQGGVFANSIPTGFWVDLTSIAHKFGWERIPALDNWRSYFRGTRFNEFVLTDNLDWRSAMLEIYPPDIFITPTVVIPPTRTATATPKGYRYKTATPTLTSTPTMRPTYTAAP